MVLEIIKYSSMVRFRLRHAHCENTQGYEEKVMMKEKRRFSTEKVVLLLLGLSLCSFALRISLTPIKLSTIFKITSPSSTLSLTSESSYYSESSLQSLPYPSSMPSATEKARSIEKQINQDNPKSSTMSRIRCDRSSSRYDLCRINGPTVVDPTTNTFYTLGQNGPTIPNSVEKIQPYPRKYETYIMAQIKNVTVISGPLGPSCDVHHNATALVFSAGGYTGNFFHDFNDGFIPLFITINTILHDEEEFVIVITEGHDWWLRKYADLLSVFSKHPIITLENEKATHCFPSANIGLISHGFMTINQSLLPNSKKYPHFLDLLNQAYGRGHRIQTIGISDDLTIRPRLVLTSRKGLGGRVIINQKKLIKMMRQIGFDVILFEPNSHTSLHKAYGLLRSCHVMIGVHGAALTHSLFLRPGAVFMQIVPIGVEWAAHAFYRSVAKQMNLEYIEYRIGVEESSLLDKYGENSTLLKNPFALQKEGWPTEIMDIYLKKQDVRLDLVRFKKCLKEAYIKAKKFMHQGGKGRGVIRFAPLKKL